MVKNVAQNGVVYYTSTVLQGVKHGFSTRLGGVSRDPYTAELNLAFGRGDSDDVVLENLSLFADALGVSPESVVSLPQIHSNNVIKITSEHCGAGYYYKESSLPDGCDGYVCCRKGVTLGVKTADCVPILLADRKNGVISALHAGWRGSVTGIASKGVEKMLELGAEASHIVAAIGPCIHDCCYEVSDDVYEAAVAYDNDLARCFSDSKNGKYMADLVSLNKILLVKSGVESRNIDTSSLCSCCYPDLFYSHRASKGKRGTMLAVITLD